MQPLTCGPAADETKTMTVAWPHTTNACHCQLGSSGKNLHRHYSARHVAGRSAAASGRSPGHNHALFTKTERSKALCSRSLSH